MPPNASRANGTRRTRASRNPRPQRIKISDRLSARLVVLIVQQIGTSLAQRDHTRKRRVGVTDGTLPHIAGSMEAKWYRGRGSNPHDPKGHRMLSPTVPGDETPSERCN